MILDGVLEMVVKKERGDIRNLCMKLSEECGEVNEQVLADIGFLDHKDQSKYEGVAGEVADVIITSLGVLARAYPDQAAWQLKDMLTMSINKKGAKYESILDTKLLGEQEIENNMAMLDSNYE